MPEQSSPLLRSVHEGVMTLVMNRPERLNALSPELYDQLAQALLHTLSIPTIAMIRGPAAGAGLSLALACDFRYADDSAKFKTAFINVGLPGDFGGHYFLPRIVGSLFSPRFCPPPIILMSI